MKKLFLILPVLCILLVAGLLYRELPHPVQLDNGAQLTWTECWFKTDWKQPTFCGYLTVSAQPKHAAKPTRLPVVWFKRSLWQWWRTPSPVLFLNGGPGGSAWLTADGIAMWRDWQQHYTQDQRDLIVYDQRGVGLSQPAIACPEFSASAMANLDRDLSGKQELNLLQTALQQCYQRLQADNIDLSAFNTPNNTQDVGDLMASIGGQQWNLYGVSYGTRLALSILRTYPEYIRSTVLDSVYPPEKNAILAPPLLFDSALTRLFKSCEQHQACRETFPDLPTAFLEALGQLATQPLSTVVPVGETSELTPIVITQARFLYILFQSLYSRELIGDLPRMIESVRHAESDALVIPAAIFVEMLTDDSFSDAVNLSVDCADSDKQVTEADFLAQLSTAQQQNPNLASFFAAQWQHRPCAIWPVADSGADFRQPVSSDIPSLFLAGAYDPVTPPNWTKETAARFSQSYFFLFDDIGHGVLGSQACADRLMIHFLANPTEKPVDECLKLPLEIEFNVDVAYSIDDEHGH